MDSARISVPLRASNISGKKMRKRRELDALVSSNGMKRYSSGYNGGPVCVKPGTNYHDQLLSESTDDQEDYWRSRSKAANKRGKSTICKKRCHSALSVCTFLLMFGCVMVTSTILWLFLDIKQQTNYLHAEMDQVVAGNQGIPESVRQCHSQTKDLQKNQSDMYSRINGLSFQLNNLSKQISSVSNELKEVQQRLRIPTELHAVPANIKELSENVTNWIRNLNETVAQMKQSQNDFQALRINVSSLKEKLLSVGKVPNVEDLAVSGENSINLKDVATMIKSLTTNITFLNETLTEEVNLVRKDFVQDHNVIEEFLSQNVSLKLSTLQEEYTKLFSLTDEVQSLTNQLNLTQVDIGLLNSKLETLSDDFNKLNKNFNQTNL